MLAENI